MQPERTSIPKQNESIPVFQLDVESGLNQLVRIGGFDSAYLYSTDGLLLAQSAHSPGAIPELPLVEMVVMMAKMSRAMIKIGCLSNIREWVAEEEKGRRWVFRSLIVFDQPALLVLLAPENKPYRGLINRIVRYIEKIGSFGAQGL